MRVFNACVYCVCLMRVINGVCLMRVINACD